MTPWRPAPEQAARGSSCLLYTSKWGKLGASETRSQSDMMVTGFPADPEVPMGQERRAFGSIERRSGYFRARYVGPDRQRYDAPTCSPNGSAPSSGWERCTARSSGRSGVRR